jgi:hypothetical protein
MDQKSQRELSRARCAAVHCGSQRAADCPQQASALDFAQRAAVPSASLTPEGAHVSEWR